jgi:hypothetical protein
MSLLCYCIKRSLDGRIWELERMGHGLKGLGQLGVLYIHGLYRHRGI